MMQSVYLNDVSMFEATSYSESDLLGAGDPYGHPEPGPTLADRFLVPPFSVLDARQGYWQERKRQWLALGMRSELGRPEALLNASEMYGSIHAGTSVFDPVLCEVAYRWWCPPGGRVLDPFAGGSVRGIVAARLGLRYCGVDLSTGQVEENRRQATALESSPEWIVGDSRLDLPSGPFDFLFSCPPYFDLEQYSDDPADLSNAGDYEQFLVDYRQIIVEACHRLANDRFACFVVGDIRDGRGHYRGFVSDTIRAFVGADLVFYNDAVLATPGGTLRLRAGRTFEGGRKLAKAHQNVLVFCKGDWRLAHEACGRFGLSDAEDLLTLAD